jgi:hypothetical protein
VNRPKSIQGWVRGLIAHPVQKKRDERLFID